MISYGAVLNLSENWAITQRTEVKKVIIVKSGALIRLTLNAIYMLILKSYFGAVLSVVIILFTIVGMINDYKNCDARK